MQEELRLVPLLIIDFISYFRWKLHYGREIRKTTYSPVDQISFSFLESFNNCFWSEYGKKLDIQSIFDRLVHELYNF